MSAPPPPPGSKAWPPSHPPSRVMPLLGHQRLPPVPPAPGKHGDPAPSPEGPWPGPITGCWLACVCVCVCVSVLLCRETVTLTQSRQVNGRRGHSYATSVCVTAASLLFTLDRYLFILVLCPRSPQSSRGLEEVLFFWPQNLQNVGGAGPHTAAFALDCVRLSDVFIQMNIKSLFSFGFLLFIYFFHSFSPPPQSYFFIWWYDYFF